tara:strand:- start:514 stop:672 length:159 start_codon:yes stop_codon:yes gene_type:complete
MAGLRNNRIYPSIHPENCKCRMCRKKKKAKKMEFRAVSYSMWFLFFFILAIA